MGSSSYSDLARVLLVFGIDDFAVLVEDHGPTTTISH